jgi:hypothetical protein
VASAATVALIDPQHINLCSIAESDPQAVSRTLNRKVSDWRAISDTARKRDGEDGQDDGSQH